MQERQSEPSGAVPARPSTPRRVPPMTSSQAWTHSTAFAVYGLFDDGEEGRELVAGVEPQQGPHGPCEYGRWPKARAGTVAATRATSDTDRLECHPRRRAGHEDEQGECRAGG